MSDWFDGLTERQRRFCEAYAANGGNAMAAAREAGYKKPAVQGTQNLAKLSIRDALTTLRTSRTTHSIARIDEAQSFWTDLMRDEGTEKKERLRASELLVKSQGGFVDKVDSTTRIIVEHVRESIDG